MCKTVTSISLSLLPLVVTIIICLGQYTIWSSYTSHYTWQNNVWKEPCQGSIMTKNNGADINVTGDDGHKDHCIAKISCGESEEMRKELYYYQYFEKEECDQITSPYTTWSYVHRIHTGKLELFKEEDYLVLEVIIWILVIIISLMCIACLIYFSGDYYYYYLQVAEVYRACQVNCCCRPDGRSQEYKYRPVPSQVSF